MIRAHNGNVDFICRFTQFVYASGEYEVVKGLLKSVCRQHCAPDSTVMFTAAIDTQTCVKSKMGLDDICSILALFSHKCYHFIS